MKLDNGYICRLDCDESDNPCDLEISCPGKLMTIQLTQPVDIIDGRFDVEAAQEYSIKNPNGSMEMITFCGRLFLQLYNRSNGVYHLSQIPNFDQTAKFVVEQLLTPDRMHPETESVIIALGSEYRALFLGQVHV